jgi:hypothetical protein
MGICFQPPGSTILMSANSSRCAFPSLAPYRINLKPQQTPSAKTGTTFTCVVIIQFDQRASLRTPFCTTYPSAGALKCKLAMLFRAPVLLVLLSLQRTPKMSCNYDFALSGNAGCITLRSEAGNVSIVPEASVLFGRRRGNCWNAWSWS